MSDGKTETQAMPTDGKKGAPDGVNTQGAIAAGGDPNDTSYPNPHTGKEAAGVKSHMDGFLGHGGQSVMGYHGSGQLGSHEVTPGGNRNAGAKTDH